MRRKEREVREPEEIRKVLDSCKVCRLGIREEDGVYVVPLNYGYVMEDGGLTLYFHGAGEGKKMELIKRFPGVGFEMDGCHGLREGDRACQYSYYFASVIGSGRAEIVEDSEEKLRALEILMKHQTGKDFSEFQENPRLEKAVGILKVTAETYTCKEHLPAPSAKTQ